MCLTVIQQLQPKEPRMQEISHKRAWSNTSHSKKSSSRFIWRGRHGWRREHAHKWWQDFAASSKTSSARRGQAGHHLCPKPRPQVPGGEDQHSATGETPQHQKQLLCRAGGTWRPIRSGKGNPNLKCAFGSGNLKLFSLQK